MYTLMCKGCNVKEHLEGEFTIKKQILLYENCYNLESLNRDGVQHVDTLIIIKKFRKNLMCVIKQKCSQ